MILPPAPRPSHPRGEKRLSPFRAAFCGLAAGMGLTKFVLLAQDGTVWWPDVTVARLLVRAIEGIAL